MFERTPYVRWVSSRRDETDGDVDDLSTGCWDSGNAETFDVDFNFWGERRGSEATGCAYGPVADHPSPELRPEFKWFTTFQWDTLELMPLGPRKWSDPRGAGAATTPPLGRARKVGVPGSVEGLRS